MRWSQMSGQQRAFLTQRATWRPEFDNTGALRRHVPFNVYARAICEARTMDKDHDARWIALTKADCARAVAEFTGAVKYLAPGNARGTGELQRKKVRAMPMQYFRKGGSIG